MGDGFLILNIKILEGGGFGIGLLLGEADYGCSVGLQCEGAV